MIDFNVSRCVFISPVVSQYAVMVAAKQARAMHELEHMQVRVLKSEVEAQ